jgi:cytochrome c oxidase cbb3-type subunit 1
VGILAGDSTGYELLEFPRYATPILFFSYVCIGTCAVLTFRLRREFELYPSQWYVLAALLWFPWTFSTAQLLLVFGSVRGALQEVVNGWAAHNLCSLWLTPLGLATVFYFVPKLTNRPLYSRSLAIFGFWLLALFGPFGGLSPGMPVPKWMSSVCVVGTMLSSVAVLAVTTNWHRTLAGEYRRWKADIIFRFILVGAISYAGAALLQAATALRPISR